MPNRLIASTLALILSTSAMPAHADDISDAIEEAAAAYAEGDLAYAQESLQFASQLIGQMKTGTLATLLPEPMEGWDADEPETETMGAALFGGGSTASRYYTKGDSGVSINYTANSPIVAQMAAMFANPAMMGGGGKLLRLGRQKAMIDDEGNVQFVVNNSIMVQIDGNASDEDKIAYAKAIDISALKDY